MKTCHFDTETMGLYGPAVILQAQFDYVTERHDDQPFLYDLWRSSCLTTIHLIQEIVECRVVAHNLTFDWQKIQQLYNALMRLLDQKGDVMPINHVDLMAQLLYDARNDYCLKPPAAVCTLLLCQKQIGGAALATKEIRVRKIPVEIAPEIAGLLNTQTDLPEILFARRATDVRWNVVTNDEGPEWSDVALKFAPSNALKDIARLVLGVKDTQKIGQDFLPPVFPYEIGYAPYAVLLNEGGWRTTVTKKVNGKEQRSTQPLWPLLLQDHLDFWTTRGTPQFKYALDDIVLLKKLDEHLGSVETDFDSELACQVSVVRTAGMEIDIDKLYEQIDASQEIVDAAEINVDAHLRVREWIAEAMDPMEALVVAEGCDKARLKGIVKNMVATERERCCRKGCPRCDGTGFVEPGPMPVAKRAKHILKIRKHRKRLQLYRKLTVAKGCFPSFRVIGTKSGRMSGTDGLNYHGIDGSREIREVFTLADGDWVVCGGDMNSQELAIAAAVMNDAELYSDIEKGKSLHGVFAAAASGIDYETIMVNKEDKGTVEAEWYKKAKICVYAILYGAASFNIAQTLGCTPEEAENTIREFFEKYPYMAQTRKMVKESLEAIRSDENGHLQVCEPKQQYIDSIFGFRRSFQAEFAVMNIMFQAMNQWRTDTGKNSPLMTDGKYMGVFDLERKIHRKENKGEQTVKSAIASALYGAVFSLQGKILRAALNHLIQSAGRTCTLRVQKRIWDEVQPVGIHRFRCKLMSVHDEIATVSPPEYAPVIEKAVVDEMADLCETVPLLSLDWASDVGSWYGVKAADEGLVRCGWKG